MNDSVRAGACFLRAKGRLVITSGAYAAMLAVLLLPGCRWPWAPAPATEPLVLSGTVDARQVDLSFQVGGRIARLLTDEGRTVRAGERVAELDGTDLQLAAERTQAQLLAARKALAVLKAGARPQELGVAQAAVAQAQADKRFADQQVARTQELVNRQFVAPEQLDRARSVVDTAAARLEQAAQSLSLLRAGARKEDIERAAAEVDAADAARQSAERQLGYAALASPVGGVVSVRLAEAGQVVGAGMPVLRVAETSRPWVRAYLAEPDLPRVRLGQNVEVRVDGAPGRRFSGRLAFISPHAEFTPKTVETRALRVDLVYRVTVDVDDPDGILKIGMPADVTMAAGGTLP
jgi:HlyD family secretion protein